MKKDEKNIVHVTTEHKPWEPEAETEGSKDVEYNKYKQDGKKPAKYNDED